MPGKGQLYKKSYGTDVSKDGTQMPLIILNALRQTPGVVQRTQSVNTSGKGDRYAVPMRKGK